MALKLLQPGIQPLGQFDGYDSATFSVKGGEVMQFGSVAAPNPPGTDLAVSDAFADGYADSGHLRVVVAFAGTSVTTDADSRPYMLSDDGVFGYGTLFGAVVGAVGGQSGMSAYGVTPPFLIGPPTTTGSGKITCWDKPGLYAVSLDAVDSSLQPGVFVSAPGTAVDFIDGSGVLCASTSGDAGGHVGVASFVSFETTGSLVTTPNSLVAALNSPSGSAAPLGQFAYVVVHFNPYCAN